MAYSSQQRLTLDGGFPLPVWFTVARHRNAGLSSIIWLESVTVKAAFAYQRIQREWLSATYLSEAHQVCEFFNPLPR